LKSDKNTSGIDVETSEIDSLVEEILENKKQQKKRLKRRVKIRRKLKMTSSQPKICMSKWNEWGKPLK